MKISRLLVAVASTALVAATAGATASASATSSAAGAPAAAPAHNYRPASCAAPPKPGYAACDLLIRTDVPAWKSISAVTAAIARKAAANSVNPALVNPYGPGDLRSAYALGRAAQLRGKGRTIAIIDAHDDPNAEADLNVYRTHFHIRPCTTANHCFTKMNQKGQTRPALMPTPDKGWAEEISLDLDMVSAICPNCKILLVEATNASLNSLGHAVRTAFQHGAKFISNSYGGQEDPSEVVADRLYYKHPGVAITASAGDDGFGVQYPAASPWVTAVGGTHLAPSSNKRGWSERAWGPPGNGNGGTGSGCSTIERKPAWQHDPACHRRTVADVSAVADPNPGVFIYDTFQDGGVLVIGGTSASAPIIAATYALAGRPAPGTFP
ncbi:MAG TPA: S8 family serine peptidase, partial [Streptosporangiaceae bacterium]|nr:S8 family serine peptidase [Streptosporangiaceae bacterium]